MNRSTVMRIAAAICIGVLATGCGKAPSKGIRGQPIVTRQIVGMLARRVVCRLTDGDDVRAGERLGIMKFGSRMDVFVPQDATITVQVGATVRGGETVIAVLHS